MKYTRWEEKNEGKKEPKCAHLKKKTKGKWNGHENGKEIHDTGLKKGKVSKGQC